MIPGAHFFIDSHKNICLEKVNAIINYPLKVSDIRTDFVITLKLDYYMNTTEANSTASTSDICNANQDLSFINERVLTLPFSHNDIIINCYDFQINQYQKYLFYDFGIPLPDLINNAVPKRQAEFLAGRYSAISALKALGINCSNIAIGKHRSPVWPDSITASITHTTTISICAASKKGSCRYLGIDIENIMSTKLVSEIKNNVINIDEEAILRKCSFNFSQAFTLAFSAKESLFKALYPSVGYYFDFTAAKITQVDNANNSFILVLTEDLTAELIVGMEFIGFFDLIEQQVLTVIAQRSVKSAIKLV